MNKFNIILKEYFEVFTDWTSTPSEKNIIKSKNIFQIVISFFIGEENIVFIFILFFGIGVNSSNSLIILFLKKTTIMH